MTVIVDPRTALRGAVRQVVRTDRTPDWLQRVIGADPGLNRLRLALQCVITIGLAILAEKIFVTTTHALQLRPARLLPPAEEAAVAGGNHALLVIAIMLGAVVGLLGGFASSMETVLSRQVLLLLGLPVPMIAGLALGLILAPYRVAALVSLVVVLAGGTYLRRFGPPGFLAGQLLFMGDFFGFFLHGVLDLSSIGWLSAEIGLGVLVALLCHLVFFAPHQRRALRRLRRSYVSRARSVVALAVELVHDADGGAGAGAGAGSPRAAARLERALVRLNETALMIDAQLAAPESSDGSAHRLHREVFDAELALSNTVRFATILGRARIPGPLLALVRTALVQVRDGQVGAARETVRRLGAEAEVATAGTLETVPRIVVRRFVSSVDDLAASLTGLDRDAEQPQDEPFRASVTLFGGWLPGSSAVSAMASTETGPRLVDRVLLAPYARVAIQMGVSVGAAVVLGDLLSGRRFYWAVIAAFVTFMGTNNAGEQVRKSLWRIVGTFVGIMVGAVLAHVVGTHTNWSVAIILVALFLGLYLMRVNYAFMVVGITVMVSQLYVQLGEFSDSLLVLRLEETAIGGGVAIATVLLVLPLRTGHAVRVAVREYVQALAAVVDVAVRRLRDAGGGVHDLRTAARALDAAHQALVATAGPGRGPFGRRAADTVTAVLAGASAARHYARNLVSDAVAVEGLDERARDDLCLATGTLSASLADVVAALDVGPDRRLYVRSAALFEVVAGELGDDPLTPPRLALRDLQLLDGAMATVAAAYGLPVRELDTAVRVG